MDIITALKTKDLRLSGVDRWLVWDDEWIVYEREAYKKKTITLCVTDNIEVALSYLIG